MTEEVFIEAIKVAIPLADKDREAAEAAATFHYILAQVEVAYNTYFPKKESP